MFMRYVLENIMFADNVFEDIKFLDFVWGDIMMLVDFLICQVKSRKKQLLK